MKDDLEEVLVMEEEGDSEGCSYTQESPTNNPFKYRVDRAGDPPMSWG